MISWKCFLINSLKSIWPPLHCSAKKRGIKHLNFKSIVLECIMQLLFHSILSFWAVKHPRFDFKVINI